MEDQWSGTTWDPGIGGEEKRDPSVLRGRPELVDTMHIGGTLGSHGRDTGIGPTPARRLSVRPRPGVSAPGRVRNPRRSPVWVGPSSRYLAERGRGPGLPYPSPPFHVDSPDGGGALRSHRTPPVCLFPRSSSGLLKFPSLPRQGRGPVPVNGRLPHPLRSPRGVRTFHPWTKVRGRPGGG